MTIAPASDLKFSQAQRPRGCAGFFAPPPARAFATTLLDFEGAEGAFAEGFAMTDV
jgi:hypothetical protein